MSNKPIIYINDFDGNNWDVCLPELLFAQFTLDDKLEALNKDNIRVLSRCKRKTYNSENIADAKKHRLDY
jgi:hypothetical protein